MSASPSVLLALLQPLLVGQVSQQPTLVKMERVDGSELWSVRAHDASVLALLERIGELSGLSIDASTAAARAPLVTIALDRRPLDQVLEFALGSAGLLVELEAGTIHVRADRSLEETPDQRAGLASAAWARAATRYPRHPVATAARLAQGELDQLRGRTEAARQRYLDVLARAPASRGASEAYLRAGRIAAARGDWEEASEHFRALANLAGADEYRAVARVELARATLQLGDPGGALYLLDQLDVTHPCWERTESTARSLIRIEALLAMERFEDALLELDQRAGNLDAAGAHEATRLRARALEGAQLVDEAARAWLLVARDEIGPSRAVAYQAAARLAEEAHDPLSVLFAAREARTAGFGPYVDAAEQRAREALGMQASAAAPIPGGVQRLEQAEDWIEKHDLDRAHDALEPLWSARDALDLRPEERARLTLAWVRCLASTEGTAQAADVARLERERLATPELRGALDRGMAKLFEDLRLFERAADAYQGDYGS